MMVYSKITVFFLQFPTNGAVVAMLPHSRLLLLWWGGGEVGGGAMTAKLTLSVIVLRNYFRLQEQIKFENVKA